MRCNDCDEDARYHPSLFTTMTTATRDPSFVRTLVGVLLCALIGCWVYADCYLLVRQQRVERLYEPGVLVNALNESCLGIDTVACNDLRTCSVAACRLGRLPGLGIVTSTMAFFATSCDADSDFWDPITDDGLHVLRWAIGTGIVALAVQALALLSLIPSLARKRASPFPAPRSLCIPVTRYLVVGAAKVAFIVAIALAFVGARPSQKASSSQQENALLLAQGCAVSLAALDLLTYVFELVAIAIVRWP